MPFTPMRVWEAIQSAQHGGKSASVEGGAQ
jgi:hypothetical protein